MNKIRFTLKAFAFLAFTLAFASAAQAQASRTWVSGVGDDANPCSRTAPCKTFAGAISKTADGGEIDALDPGGFGAVTITKSITIDGQGTFASILAAGTNGVNVNDSLSGAPNSKVVALRNLSINGFGSGLIGINFTSGKEVNVENCVIFGFKSGTGVGIFANLNAAVSGNQRLHVLDTIIRDCSSSAIKAQNTGVGGAVNVTVERVNEAECGAGASASTASRWFIKNSNFHNNTATGIEALTGNSGIDVDTCGMQGNVSGIATAAGTMRITNCSITNNTNGINFVGGVVQTYGDNKVHGNGNDQLGGSVTAVPAPTKL